VKSINTTPLEQRLSAAITAARRGDAPAEHRLTRLAGHVRELREALAAISPHASETEAPLVAEVHAMFGDAA
jgi:hypothetical protein